MKLYGNFLKLIWKRILLGLTCTWERDSRSHLYLCTLKVFIMYQVYSATFVTCFSIYQQVWAVVRGSLCSDINNGHSKPEYMIFRELRAVKFVSSTSLHVRFSEASWLCVKTWKINYFIKPHIPIINQNIFSRRDIQTNLLVYQLADI